MSKLAPRNKKSSHKTSHKKSRLPSRGMGRSHNTPFHKLENTEFEGVVRDVTTHGKGVVEHPSGLAVFVPLVWLNEFVKVRIQRVKKQFAEGELVSVIKAHPERIEPRCEYFRASPACGGCTWQFVSYDAQLEVKQQWVKKAFAHVINDTVVAPIWGSDKPWYYRNRAEFKFDGVKLGYLSSQSNHLIHIKDCPVLDDKMTEHLGHLLEFLPALASGDMASEDAITAKKASPKKPALIAVDSDMAVGQPRFNQRLDFRQTNDGQNQRLKQWLRQVLSVCSRQSPIVELFSGAGNFTEVLVDEGFEQIVAAEFSASAIEMLNAKQLQGVTGRVADLFDEKALSRLCRDVSQAETLVLDPPREGLLCIEPLLAHKHIKCIAYISCNLATCQRDVKRFVEAGFSCVNVQPVDMFPQTPHLELCVLLTRPSGS